MIVSVKTAAHGIIKAEVANNREVARLLCQLMREGEKCLGWKVEKGD